MMYLNTDEVAMLVPVLVAAIFGGLIGIERETRHKPAGVGTNVLICAGACMFTLLSIRMDPSSPSRIASNILTGVGFIGAGLILKEVDGSIHGLTTAAGIWMAAAVGMGVGFHYYLLATIGTLLAVFAPRLPDWSGRWNKMTGKPAEVQAAKPGTTITK